MTTAQAIEGITDAALFEILATRVLRLIDNDCKFLEHMGVNTEGKIIANPVDGFCMVPGTNPPRFVMVAFTTDKVENLERKWLFDHSTALKAKKATAADDGDLIKASRRAQSLRDTHPNATFVVHLCTNKQPDDMLMQKVLARGSNLGSMPDFLEGQGFVTCLIRHEMGNGFGRNILEFRRNACHCYYCVVWRSRASNSTDVNFSLPRQQHLFPQIQSTFLQTKLGPGVRYMLSPGRLELEKASRVSSF